MEKNQESFVKQPEFDSRDEVHQAQNDAVNPFGLPDEPYEEGNDEDIFSASGNTSGETRYRVGPDSDDDERARGPERPAREEKSREKEASSGLLGRLRERLSRAMDAGDLPIWPGEDLNVEPPRCGEGRLVLLQKRGSSKEPIEIPRGRGIVIGRTKGLADVVLSFGDVSEQHAKVTYEHGVYYLSHLSETNETRINGKKMVHGQPVEIQHGDEIIFASHKFYARFEDEQ